MPAFLDENTQFEDKAGIPLAGGEVFLNLPIVSTGTSGSLWSDSGTVKVVP